MKKGEFRAVVVTRGLLVAVSATILAFVIAFIGVSQVISGARLVIGQQYVMRAVADSSGTFYTNTQWENKEGKKLGVGVVKFLLGLDISSAQAVVSNVSGSIVPMPVEDVPTMAQAEEPIPTVPMETPTSTPKTKATAKPEVIEQKMQVRTGNTKGKNGISINNQTNYSVDVDSILSEPIPFKISNKGPQVLIVHTHTTESYTPSPAFQFTHSETDRTTDTRYSVARVGDELEAWLKKYKINTIHDKTLHDYPEFVFAYNRAFSTISSDLAKNPSIKIVIDLHRDAIFSKNSEKVKITDVINNEKVAQIMSVVGTNQLGLKHDNWRTNLKFALMLQEQFVSIHPSFARPVNLRDARFNGHTAPGAVIIEVGSSGNTLDEALASCQYIAKALSAVMGELK